MIQIQCQVKIFLERNTEPICFAVFFIKDSVALSKSPFPISAHEPLLQHRRTEISYDMYIIYACLFFFFNYFSKYSFSAICV